MTDKIGIDEVELEAAILKGVEANRAAYDALSLEQRQLFRKQLAAQILAVHQLLEEERRKVLDHVLQIMDVIERVERVPPILRKAIIEFRDKA